MKLSELIAAYRSRADDRAVPYLHEDADIIGFANQAENEAAERSLCFRDNQTPSVCQLALTQGVKTYPLDARVIDVIDAKVRGQDDSMTREPDELHVACPYEQTGIPERYAIITTGSKCVLVLDREAPDPATVAGTSYQPYIDLTVYRRPLNPLVDPTDEPEINPARHADLLFWMLYLGYSTRDSDAGSDSKAATNDARFQLAFGMKIDLNVKRKQLRHRPPVSRPHYY